MIKIPSRLPEGRVGQALAVVVTLCILLGIIVELVQPAWQWFGARQQQLAAEQEQIAHIRALQGILPQLRQQASAAAAASGTAQILLAGSSDSIAEANLQSALTVLANGSGASLTSAAVVAGQVAGSLRRVGLQLEMAGSWQALTQMLVSIDSARPRMLVNNLSISSSESGGAEDTLQASFTVSAFRAGGEP